MTLPDDPYQRLLDEARHREVVGQRARERWLRTRLEDGARLAGTLTDLAERRVTVQVHTEAGAAFTGRLTEVAGDHVTVVLPNGAHAHVATAAVSVVRPDASVRHVPATGERPAPVDRTLAEALARLAAQQPRVALRVRGHRDPLAGRLRAVGRDVASLELDGPDGGLAYVPVAAVAAVVVDG